MPLGVRGRSSRRIPTQSGVRKLPFPQQVTAKVRRMLRGRLTAIAVVLLAGAACTSNGGSLSGDQVADDLVNAMHGNQFYESALRAECEPVDVKAGAISDCTVWFKRGIYMGDTARQHTVRVTFEDADGHFSYYVGG